MKKIFFLSCFLSFLHQTSFAVDTEKNHLTVEKLLINYDNGEGGSDETFKKALLEECKNILHSNVSYEEKFLNLSKKVLFKHDEPRFFNNIDSPYFTAFIDVLASFVINKTPSLFTTRVAKILAISYSSIIPKSGLSLDDPYIKNCLKWHNYILDQVEEITDSKNFIDSCLYIAGLYTRRARACSDNELCEDSIRMAFEYLEKGAKFIETSVVHPADIQDYFRQTALIFTNWSKTGVPYEKNCRRQLFPSLERANNKLLSLCPSTLGFFAMIFATSNLE